MTYDILKQRQVEKLEMEHEHFTYALKCAVDNEDIENILNELEEIELELKELKGE